MGASIREDENHWELNLSECPRAYRPIRPEIRAVQCRFRPAFVKQGIPLRRSHSLINALASYILDGVLDPESLEKDPTMLLQESPSFRQVRCLIGLV